MKILLKIAYQILKIYWFTFRPVTCGVRVLLVRDESVVLVQHTYQDAWFLPGGGIKRSETLEQAIRREAMEECGASLTSLQLLGAYTQFDNYRTDQIVLFLSKEFSLTGKSDHEIDQVAIFPFEQLPDNTSPGSRRRIQDYARRDQSRQGYCGNDRQTDYLPRDSG